MISVSVKHDHIGIHQSRATSDTNSARRGGDSTAAVLTASEDAATTPTAQHGCVQHATVLVAVTAAGDDNCGSDS
jgi:hypothetical protein